MTLTRVVKTLLWVLLAATAAQAQITTSNVKVLITGKRCSELKDLYLVINGEDLEDRWVKLEPEGSCRWTARLADGISTSAARFSIRGGFVRSDCQKAIANEADLSANLEFACCADGPLRNMRVKIEPPMPVSYIRDVRPFPGSRLPGLNPCFETATFDAGQGAIGQAQFSGEDVYLHLGPLDRRQLRDGKNETVEWRRQRLGLLLNDVVVDASDDNDGTLVLTRDDVAYRLLVQRAKGKSRSAPTTSPNAILVDMKKLGELKLERAEIEVIK